LESLNKSVVPVIESVYETFTNSERTIADFFLENVNDNRELSASNVSNDLHVSEASLTRFAKKCGYSGYREFIYMYKLNIADSPDQNFQYKLTKKVLADYDEILNKTYSLIDEKQIKRIIDVIIQAKRVYFYGVGSSGLVVHEMKSRFMRLGLSCDAFTDPDMIKMNSALLDEDDIVIALSISSNTPAIITAMKQAHNNNAKTVLLTANNNNKFKEICDEIISVAMRKNLDFGNRISPQFPLLVMIDIIYAYFLNSDFDTKTEKLTSTLTALDEEVK